MLSAPWTPDVTLMDSRCDAPSAVDVSSEERGASSTLYRVSVKALVFDRREQLLVVQNALGLWEIPGGGWEHGESLDDCVRRELREELGVSVAHVQQTPAIASVASWQNGYPLLRIAVRVQIADPPFRLGDGMQATAYVTAAEFDALEMHPADRWPEARRLWATAS